MDDEAWASGRRNKQRWVRDSKSLLGGTGLPSVCKWVEVLRGFPGSSAGKESVCNAGDPGSISESGSSPGEGIGYPLQYSWASLVA